MKKDSGWEKDGDGMKGGVDDGTAVWGNAVRHGTKPSNWKDGNKYGGNSKCHHSICHTQTRYSPPLSLSLLPSFSNDFVMICLDISMFF